MHVSAFVHFSEFLVQNETKKRQYGKYDILVLIDSTKILSSSNNYLKIFLNSPQFRTILGLTDGITEDLSRYFKTIFSYDLEDAIRDYASTNYRILKFEDFSSGNLSSQTLNAVKRVILECTQDEKTIVFCNTIEIAERLSFLINQENGDHYSRVVTTKQSRNELKNTLHLFRKDNSPFLLTSTELLATGFNLPNVRNIVLLRNFSSSQYAKQFIFRFLQSYPGKDRLNVFDFSNVNWEEETDLDLKYFNDSQLPNRVFDSKQEHENESIRFGKSDIPFRDRNFLNGVIGVDDLAEELSDVITRMPYEQGRMIGIFGKWGRGKTFLMDETWKRLRMNPRFNRIDFHAWKYQETPAIWAYLYETFADAYYNSAPKKHHKWNRFWRRVRLIGIRLGWASLLWVAISLTVTAYLFFCVSKITLVFKLLGIFSISSLVGVLRIYFKYKSSARELFKKYCSKHSFSNLLGVQAEVQKELKHLLKAWLHYDKELKILLFVDDIDRCHEEKIIRLIDSLRVMLDDKKLSENIYVVTAIDERILKRAIRLKYSPLIDPNVQGEEMNMSVLIAEYIDKLFILGLKLGDLSGNEKDEFFMELTREDREQYRQPRLVDINAGKNVEPAGSPPDSTSRKESDEFSPEFDPTIEDLHTEMDQVMEGEVLEEQDSYLNSKLNVTEISLLRKKLQLCGSITPRQIRIFYYRYLVGKNLLIRKYGKINNENIWTRPEFSEVFIELLIKYSQHSSKCSLTEDKAKMLQGDQESITFNDITVSKDDYETLIGILDIIIGY